MANNIDTSQVVDPNTLQPFLAPSLAFLQAATKEQIKGIIYGLLGESLFSYVANGFGGAIVSGCTKSGGGSTLFNGWIWYADELFFCPGAMGLTSYSNPPRVIIDETNDASIDPIQFSDLTMKSVHKIRRLKVVDQASGGFLLSAMGRFISDTEVLPANYTHAAGIIVDIPSATFTSPPRVCDLEIEFHYDFRMIQIASAAVKVNVEMFGPGILRTNAHRMEGFGAAANQAITSHGVMRYTYRNCPANQVVKMRYQDIFIGAAGEWSFGTMVLVYREIQRKKLW